MRCWAVWLLVSGCSSILGIEDFEVGDAGGGDTGGAFCLGPTGWRICLPAAPTEPETFGSELTLDTKGSSKCLDVQPKEWKDAGQPDACIIRGSNITITAPLHATNTERSRPLVLFAANDITVRAAIDIASHLGSNNQVLIAAGADPARCTNPDVPGTSNAPGGGAGGSFMHKGGNGGAGSISPGSPAKDADATRPVTLRGGCAGAAGGEASTKGGIAGQGGGAIYLVAGGRISIDGAFINASGGPGDGAPTGSGGGGGGGSGGMIVLHAPTITGNGTLIANGGGGGGGAGSTSGLASQGAEPAPAMPTSAAQGGSGTGTGGRGGAGFAKGLPATTGIAAGVGGGPGGGGGGGGGGGYILMPDNPLIASPQSQPFP